MIAVIAAVAVISAGVGVALIVNCSDSSDGSVLTVSEEGT